MSASRQPSLFDAAPGQDDGAAQAARARMRSMIDRLRTTSEPTWPNEMAIYLETGVFQRAMLDVPKPEAEALLAEFDREMDRLQALWEADPARAH